MSLSHHLLCLFLRTLDHPLCYRQLNPLFFSAFSQLSSSPFSLCFQYLAWAVVWTIVARRGVSVERLSELASDKNLRAERSSNLNPNALRKNPPS